MTLNVKKIKEFNSYKDYLNLNQLELRKYQLLIAENCINKNSLVVIPTGLGKTIIAVLLSAKILELSPKNSKIIILAPTRPLIDQHYISFSRFLLIPNNKFEILTGRTSPDKRADLFQNKKILFFTPQTLRNDLVNGKYSLKEVCLLIFDEAHHASGNYPYCLIADKYLEQNPDGTILGLTASPGSTKKQIAKLCQNLHILPENIHIRSRKDEDVKEYVKPLDIYKIGVDITELMNNVNSVILKILEERLLYLAQLNFLNVKKDKIIDKVIRKDLLKLNQELIEKLKGNNDKTGVYSALSINAQALILYHMIELVEQQGLDILLNYLDKLNNDAKKNNSSKAIKMLAADLRLRQIYIELKKNQEFSPKSLIHPKYDLLENLILKEIKSIPNSRILIFVKLRDSVRSLVEKLNENKLIRSVKFVGQASKSKNDKGLSQKKQLEILQQFKNGIFNVLVSTNIGEEGLDIAECDVVIFYDVVVSEIRLLQRKGRTARQREGKVVILYCKNSREEKYLNIALNRLKMMKKNLKNTLELKKYYQTYQNKQLNENLEKKSINEKYLTENKNLKEKVKKDKQSDLNFFLNDDSYNREQIRSEKNKDIIISKSLPLKFGLRKKLKKDSISFSITDGNHDIIIYNKILIRIYEPKMFSVQFSTNLLEIFEKLQSRYKLIVVMLDFIDFKEEFDGEKYLLKKKIQEFGFKQDIQVISIDNEEELYFIIKNIYNHINRKRD
ncbi:MAG: DEAD/DEAH box helicase [Promethearchaeota archaeon]